MDLNGLPQTVQNFINDTIQYRESGNCLDYDTCQKILEYAADTGSQKLTGLGLYYLAECYWQKGEYENTMQCLTEGVGCLENARMYELLAKAHNMMGAVSDRKNNRMLALSSYYNSLKYAEKYHFYYIQGMAESNIAYTLVRMRLRQEAIQHYRIAIACYDKSEKTYQLNYNRINCMIECGCCHMYLGEMEEALQLWNEIEKILREAPESYYSKITLEMYRIPCELLKGHEEEALKLASDLLEQLSDRDVFEEIMDELVILAGILAILPDGKYLEELIRNGTPCTIFMIDIDEFKKINDTYGHAAGDDALRELAARMKMLHSQILMPYRYAGDEFIIIIQSIQSKIVDKTAMQCKELFFKPFSLAGEFRRVGGSIGIASFPKDASTLEELIECADSAMYTVKKSGKNRFAYYEGGKSEEK